MLCPVSTGKVILPQPVDVLSFLYKKESTKEKTCGYVYLLLKTVLLLGIVLPQNTDAA